MSRGLGTTQHRILEVLAEQSAGRLGVTELAKMVGISDRQARTAVRALERRELVVITNGPMGWAGRGSYGRLVHRLRWFGGDDDLPANVVLEEDDPWPGMLGFVATGHTELIRAGMPVHGLLVWLPERYAERRAKIAALAAKIRALDGDD